jgi:hypothetical protein
MKYCRAVPEVVKSKENLAYLKDFISKVGYENSSEVQDLSFPGLLFSLLSELSNFYYCLK